MRSETMLPVSATEAARLIFDVNRDDLLLAAAYGNHGASWHIEATGGGDTGPPTTMGTGPIECYVVNTTEFTVVLGISDTLIPDAQWRYIAPWYLDSYTGQLVPLPLDEGDVLRSAYDATRFLVRTVHQDGHNTVGICELL
jgi:hypothetical protein